MYMPVLFQSKQPSGIDESIVPYEIVIIKQDLSCAEEKNLPSCIGQQVFTHFSLTYSCCLYPNLTPPGEKGQYKQQ